MEGGHHHHLAGADDVGQRRVHLRVDVLEVDVQHRVPGFLQIGKGLIQHHAHDAQLGRGELAALDLGVAPVTSEEIVHQLEYQLGVEDEQCRATQRLHLHQVEAGRHVQRMHVLAELHHLDAAHRDIGRAAQQVEHADAGITGETLVDHLQRGHAPAHDTVLTGQVVALDGPRLGIAFGIHQTVVDPVQERIDLVLREQVLNSHLRQPSIAIRSW